MKRTITSLLLVVFGFAGIAASIAQPPPRDGEDRPRRGTRDRGPGGGRGWMGPLRGGPERGRPERGRPERGPEMMMRMLPVMRALDADNDGVISASEIKNAATALAELDKNDDGRLTIDELRPQRPVPGDLAGMRGTGPEAIWDRLKRLDENDDGVLAGDEIPERMQRLIPRNDRDGDGKLSTEEMRAMVDLLGRRGRGAGAGEAMRDRPRRGRRGGDAAKPQTREAPQPETADTPKSETGGDGR